MASRTKGVTPPLAGTPGAALAAEQEEQIFDLVYRQMRALSAGRERDLDDLVQDAMEQTIKALPSFQGRSQLSTWTYQICYRTLLKSRRTRSRWLKRFFLTNTGELPEMTAPLSNGTAEERERARRLRAALAQLSPKKRTAVVLHDLEGHSSEEIAEITQTGLGTVRSRLRDGRKELLSLLSHDPYFGEHE